MSEINVKPIGIVHSPFTDPVGTPIQPASARGIRGTITIEPEYAEGLEDLEGFSHLILIYYFHQAGEEKMKVKPFLDDQMRGVFSTRAPRRPNKLGISVVRLLEIEGNRLEIEDLDLVDGTPLLDIKPYIPEFDPGGPIRIGWLENKRGEIEEKKADDRFADK